MQQLRVLSYEEQEWQLLDKYVRSLGRDLTVLEAGCGRFWPLKLDDIGVTMTGIDADAEAIKARTDLAKSIVGDICDEALAPREGFDVVFNSYVLEHVRGAEKALRNLIGWTRPGGLLILRIPDRDSAYGAVTRLTPLWFHILYKRLVQRFKESGEPGFGPYPTYHEKVVSVDGVKAVCAATGCEIVDHFAHGYYLTYPGGGVARRLAQAVWLLSFGRFAWKHNDLTFVIRKGPAAAGRT